MKTIRMVIGIIVSAVGFLYLLFAYIMITWDWSNSGGHGNATQWAFAIIPWSVPFLFSLWLVYRCVGSNLKHALAAEVWGLIVPVLLWGLTRFTRAIFRCWWNNGLRLWKCGIRVTGLVCLFPVRQWELKRLTGNSPSCCFWTGHLPAGVSMI